MSQQQQQKRQKRAQKTRQWNVPNADIPGIFDVKKVDLCQKYQQFTPDACQFMILKILTTRMIIRIKMILVSSINLVKIIS